MTGNRNIVVSIGMPAHNSERTIRMAIDGLLQQTFTDFELIISDNASTDGTWPIIDEYARRDGRIVAMRQERNLGANGNYSAVFAPARGLYFKWASSNDWCAPDLLEKCVAYLAAHPDTVLVAPRSRLFRDSPDAYSDYDKDVAFDHDDAVERFIQVTSRLALNNVVNGVFRTGTLRRTRLMEHYPEADIVLLARAALQGKIAVLNERLYYRRMSADSATPLMDDDGQRRHLYPRRSMRSLFPAWRLAAGWVRAVLASDLSAADRLRALDWALRLGYWRRALLWRDLAEAVRYPLRSLPGEDGSSRPSPQ